MKLKKKVEGTPNPVAADSTETDGREQKRDSIIAKKITDAAKPFGGLRDGGKSRQITLKPKKSFLMDGGLTPLGKEAKDSLQKSGVVSAVRTVARGIGKEVKDSFATAKPTPKTEPKKNPLPNPDLSKVAPAAKQIDQKANMRLKRLSQQITRGTPAANKLRGR